MKVLKIVVLCIVFALCMVVSSVYGYMQNDGIPMSAAEWRACDEGGGCKLITRQAWDRLKAASEAATCNSRI